MNPTTINITAVYQRSPGKIFTLFLADLTPICNFASFAAIQDRKLQYGLAKLVVTSSAGVPGSRVETVVDIHPQADKEALKRIICETMHREAQAMIADPLGVGWPLRNWSTYVAPSWTLLPNLVVGSFPFVVPVPAPLPIKEIITL